MDVNSIFQAIGTLGFPVVMCIIICFYLKSIIDKVMEQLSSITTVHREETSEMRKAIENNTIALNRLIEKIES